MRSLRGHLPLLLATLAIVAQVAWADERVQIVVDRVEILADTTPGSQVLASATRGMVLEVLGREGNWIRVATPGTGYAGYIPRSACEGGAGIAPPPASYPTVPAAPAPPMASQPSVSVAEPTVPEQVTAAPSAPGGVPMVEIYGGYSFLYDDGFTGIELDEGEVNGRFPLGWLVSASVNVTDRLGIVGEVSGHYKSEEFFGEDLDFSVLAFHGGLRYTDRDDPIATPYAQLLAGATRGSVSLLDESESETDFSIQPGVGVMFRVSDRVRIGLGGDYRLVFSEDDKTNEFRLHVGVVFGAGSR